MARLVLALGFVFVLGAAVSACGGNFLANVSMQRGIAYYEQGQYDRAIRDFDEAIRLDAGYVHAWNNRGLTYSNKGQYDRAIRDLDEAIRLDPGHVPAWHNRGAAYYNKGDYDQAIRDFDEVIRLADEELRRHPYYVETWNKRGNAYLEKGQYDQAIRDYDEAIRLDPGHVHAWNNRGLAYSKKGQYERAIRDYDEALRLDPGYVLAWDNRGIAYSNKGQYERAIRDFNEAIRLDPGYADARYNLGVMYENGRGVPQDSVQALMWFNIAASQGNERAAESLKQFSKSMTPAQIAEAEKLARERPQREARERRERPQREARERREQQQRDHRELQEELSVIRVGATREQVEDVLGEPDESESGDGATIHVYRRQRGSAYVVMYVTYGPDGTVARAETATQHREEEKRRATADLLAKAQCGDAHAQFNLGARYSNGWGVPKDLARAYFWYGIAHTGGVGAPLRERLDLSVRVSAEQIAEAERLMAEWEPEDCDNGIVEAEKLARERQQREARERRERQQREAREWREEEKRRVTADLLAKAQCGDADAQFDLGVRYRNGWGVPKDLARAYFWYGIAHTGGVGFSPREALPYLSGRITPEQIAEGEQMMADWEPEDCSDAARMVTTEEVIQEP